MPKSVNQQKKEIRGHIGALRQAAGRLGLSEAMYDLYLNKLNKLSKQSELVPWYRDFARRVGAQISQDSREAAFMRGQLHSIESILGLRR